MQPTQAEISESATKSKPTDGGIPLGGRRFNFSLMAIYHVILRTGWIFKTETIIMPAVLDLIGGGGWLRGCLPMLNRFGQSVPPLLASDWLRNQAIKKTGLAVCSSIMGACFLALSFVWWQTGGNPTWWLPIVFLCIYAVFFASTGINQLIFSTLTGKLIATRRRGRLMLVSSTIGATSAVFFAWFLLRIWLGQGEGNFAAIFAFTGVAFFSGGILACFFREHADVPTGTKRTGRDLFRMSFSTLVVDKNFRLLAVIAGLFGMSMTLMPHYQNIALGLIQQSEEHAARKSAMGLTALIPWLIAQNVGAAAFSIPVGWLGDRFGYRLVLRIILLMVCVAPVVALILKSLGANGISGFTFVFCLLGLTPVTMRTFNNYTLEIVEAKYHPRYLATLSLCMAAPAILTSSLLGAMVDFFSFELVYILILALLLIGWLLTFKLEEPRNAISETG